MIDTQPPPAAFPGAIWNAMLSPVEGSTGLECRYVVLWDTNCPPTPCFAQASLMAGRFSAKAFGFTLSALYRRKESIS